MLPAPQNANANRGGFTLFEVCIAVFIGVMIILAAVPSLSGVIEDQRAKKLFTQFDDLAREASIRAVTERRAFVLEWDNDGVTMRPLAPTGADDAQDSGRVDFGEKLAPDLLLPGALVKDPPRVWTFWPTGTCEPATVTSHVPGASWTASYNPLTEQPYFTSP